MPRLIWKETQMRNPGFSSPGIEDNKDDISPDIEPDKFELHDQLLCAILFKEVGLVEELLRTDYFSHSNAINHTYFSGIPLHVSVAGRPISREIVKILLDHPHIDINIKDEQGETAFRKAMKKGHADVVALFLEKPEINVIAKHEDGWHHLLSAVYNEDIKMAGVLLDHSTFDTNVTDSDGRTILHIAALRGNEQLVRLILGRSGVDINAKDKHGATVLTWCLGQAALTSKREPETTDIICQLLDHPGIDVNLPDGQGNLPLLTAVAFSHISTVRRLLGCAGINVNAYGFNYPPTGMTPLTFSSCDGERDIVRLLLDHPDIDVNLPDKDGFSALHHAAMDPYDDIVRLLLNHPGINVNPLARGNVTPLMLAAIGGKTETLKRLLDYEGIGINMRDAAGQTALSLASNKDYGDIVEILRNRGAM